VRFVGIANKETAMASDLGGIADDQLRQLLARARRIAVVGLSPRPERPSYQVAEYLQRQGYEITPVNPLRAGTAILGVLVRASLTELELPPDIVDIFRRPVYVPDVVADATAARAQLQARGAATTGTSGWVIWTQLGVVNPDAARRARELGFVVVEDRCLRVEHRRLGVGRVA
jgi:predicted CoA-binding protein